MTSVIQMVVVVLVTLHPTICLPTDNDTSGGVTAATRNAFDDALVTSILKIVDVKFESISSRIGSLERAMSSLQYYNLRQFRVVSTHMRALDTILQATHSEMGELEIENKETKISIDLLKKEVKNMEKVQNAMFDSMEKHFEKLDLNMDRRFDDVENTMEDILNVTGTQATEEDDYDILDSMTPLIESLASILNDSDRFSFEKLQTLEDKVDTYHNITMSKLETVEVEITNTTNDDTEERSLLETLVDLNDNVLRSIAFYRHTGDLVERIVGATETVADDQDMIRSDLRLFLEIQTNHTICKEKQEAEFKEMQTDKDNEFPNVITTERDLHTCKITLLDLKDMSETFRNSTHLTELWTEMAQMNQFTLRTTVMDLMAEVAKIHTFYEKINTASEQTTPATPNLFTGLMEYDLESIANSTKAVFQIVEAVASNTGWIPYIFHNLQYVEGQVNETVRNTKKCLQKQGNGHDSMRFYKDQMNETAEIAKKLLQKQQIFHETMVSYEDQVNKTATNTKKLLEKQESIQETIRSYEDEVSETSINARRLLKEQETIQETMRSYEYQVNETAINTKRLLQKQDNIQDTLRSYEDEVSETSMNARRLLKEQEIIQETMRFYGNQVNETAINSKKLFKEQELIQETIRSYENEVSETSMNARRLLTEQEIIQETMRSYENQVNQTTINSKKLLKEQEIIQETMRSYEDKISETAINSEKLLHKQEIIQETMRSYEYQANETATNARIFLQEQNMHEPLGSRVRTEALTARPAETRIIDVNDEFGSPTDLVQSSGGNTSYLDKLNIIYRTNLKMHRLIPALTRLLGEPEPFITLVDGRIESEGRVEIYRNGRWGTMCKTIGHVEASYLCRHLGYLGGISAGSGVFGPGDGVFWDLNMTCLLTRRCEIASAVESGQCDHQNDAAIICDHMLRLDTDERKRKSAGYLSIHHRGNWLSICADNWTSQNSDVACRQLGYHAGQSQEDEEDPMTVDTSHLWLRNITCSGSETRLDGCDNVSWTHGCESSTPIRIVCT